MTTQGQASRNLIVGLSGPSSSGKTTVARLLRSIFNIPASPATNHNAISLFILHEDDFYKTDAEIPVVTTPSTRRRLQDWDCAAALDLPRLERTLRFIHANGRPPPDLQSKEDGDDVAADVAVSAEQIDACRRRLVASLLKAPRAGTQVRICVLEGFLLYPDPDPDPGSGAQPSIPPSLTALLDLRLFLRSTHALTRSRREARPGYVTLEGFWEDPDGYVDEVVWPNYVREHAWMFEGGDVDCGELRSSVAREGICVGPGKGERSVEELVGWAAGVLAEKVESEMGALQGEGEGGGGRGPDSGSKGLTIGL